MASKKTAVDDETLALADGTSVKYGLPDGVLAALVAEDSAEFSPKEVKRLREDFGIDPKLSKRNEVEAMALLLSDSLERNKGDVSLGLAEYRGGADRRAWTDDTTDFVKQVSSRRSSSGFRMGDAAAASEMPTAGRRSASGATAPPAAPAPFSKSRNLNGAETY